MNNKLLKTVALTAGVLTCTAFSTQVNAEEITVKSGDTLWKLAEANHTTIDNIISANHLTSSDYLYIGQTLAIPTTHTVKSGETLWIISQKYNVSIQSLLDLNNLSSTDYLYIGQTLNIKSTSNSQTSTNITSYTVQPGDSLWIISNKFNVTIDQLKNWNNISGSEIYVGQQLSLKQNEQQTASKADQIITTAKQYIGVPYQWGGESPSGFDCSGFVQYVFTKNGVSIPRTTTTQYNAGTSVTSLKPGDIVFFETYKSGPSHDGIYIGNGKFIHASSSHGITISSLSNTYWKPKYLGAKRFLN